MTQCFQLVYTDATMRFLDDKVNEAAAGLSLGSSTVRSGTTHRTSSTDLMLHLALLGCQSNYMCVYIVSAWPV